MEDNTKKRSRKSKLVPRDFADLEDEKNISLQDANQTILPKLLTEINKSHELLDADAAPAMQFDINIEVEECGEDFRMSEAEDSNDELSEPPGAYNDSIPIKHCTISRPALRKKIEELSKTTSSFADKQLEIEIRNSWGKYQLPIEETPYESLIQNAITLWKAWYYQSKARETISAYKCYICDLAWWHLASFHDHIQQHELTKNHAQLKIELETFHHECNLVCFYGVNRQMKDLHIDGKCWRCLKGAEEHMIHKRNSTMYYFCKACNSKFFTCTHLAEHEGICQKYHKMFFKDEIRYESDWKCSYCPLTCITKTQYDAHMIARHSVRSDIPIASPSLKICTLCDGKYNIYNLHACSKKSDNANCKFCCRKFKNKLLANIHEKYTKDDYFCTICSRFLRKQCMVMEHMVKHSRNYTLAYKCVSCTTADTLVLFHHEYAIKKHRLLWHKKRNDKRRSCYETLVVPTACMTETEEMTLLKSPSGEEPVCSSTSKQKRSTASIVESNLDPTEPLKKKKKSVRRRTEESAPLVAVDEMKNAVNTINTIKDEKIDYENNMTDNAIIHQQNIKKEPENDEEVIEKTLEVVKDVSQIPDISQGDNNVLQKILDQECSTIEKDMNFVISEIKTEIPDIKEEEEDYLEFDEPTDEIENSDHEDPINEQDDCIEALSKVFQASKNITGVLEGTHIERTEMCREDLLMKVEPIDEEDFYEDDIIVLNSSNTVDTIEDHDENNEESKTDHVSEIENSARTHESGSEIDMTKFEPEITIFDGKRKKLYQCNKCNYEGLHRDFKMHILESCPPKQHPKKKGCKNKKSTRGVWTDYRCTKCNTSFSDITKYVVHFKDHNLKHGTCPQCFLVFDSTSRAVLHLMPHIRQSFVKIQIIKPNSVLSKTKIFYQCRSCNAEVQYTDFFRHWEMHLGIKTEKEVKMNSDDNDASSVNDDNEEKQLKIKTALNPKAIKDLAVLIQMSPYNTRLSKEMKYCKLCDRDFVRRNDCKRHLIEHLLGDAFANKPKHKCLKCQICHDKFDNASSYKSHMRDHASLPVYMCGLCNKTFSDSSNFAKHKKVHNLRVMICDICKKKFQARSSLEKHLELHKTTKPINCRQCDRVFYSQSQYRKHVRGLHEKVRSNFWCSICRAKFRSLKEKWEHMWVEHQERKHKADCPVCNKSFRKFHDVKKHVRDDHKLAVPYFSMKMFNTALKQEMEAPASSTSAGDVEDFLKNSSKLVVKNKNQETLVIFE